MSMYRVYLAHNLHLPLPYATKTQRNPSRLQARIQQNQGIKPSSTEMSLSFYLSFIVCRTLPESPILGTISIPYQGNIMAQRQREELLGQARKE